MRMITLARRAAPATLILLGLSGCGPGRPQRPPMGPPEVGIVVIQPQAVQLSTVLPGRTSPFAISEVRPQINGIVKARLFKEGTNVRVGEVLYQIDPAPYQAAYDQAKAALAAAEANLATTKIKAERYKDLVSINGVSRQDSDDATAAYLQAQAAVQQNQALVQAAKINLGYTRITAPISGRIGRSSFTVGALATAGQAGALTTVQTLDPIYVDIDQSTAELLKLRRDIAKGRIGPNGPTSAAVTLQLEDGSRYPLKGRLEFQDVTVDQTTGAVALRAIFPNPDGVLLPGMYVRAVVDEGAKPDAILAPQQGVTRNQAGEPIATVVGRDGRAEVRDLVTDGVVGDKWLISSGLGAGDRLIVEGLQKVTPGAPVRPVPAGSPPDPGPPGGPRTQGHDRPTP